MSIELVMPSNHLILCNPLLLPPSIFPNIRVFSNELVICIRWPNYQSFSFNINPSNEYSRLISFRIDWLDLFAVQGTLKSLLQHHSSRASVLWQSAFFIVLLSHLYMTTGKTIALTRQIFVGKVMCRLGWSQLFFQGAMSFNFMAAITICGLVISKQSVSQITFNQKGKCQLCLSHKPRYETLKRNAFIYHSLYPSYYSCCCMVIISLAQLLGIFC